MQIRRLRILSTIGIGAITLVMWYPKRVLFGIDLSDRQLQAATFGLCMFLWTLARGGRLRSDPYHLYRSSSWQVDGMTMGRNVIRMAFEMLLLAAVLEVGQMILPLRNGAFGEFLFNALVVVAVGTVCYLCVALALRTTSGRRVIQLFGTPD